MNRNIIVLVCNTFHPDHVDYFKTKIKSVSSTDNLDVLIFKNSHIDIFGDNVYISSFSKKSFFDKTFLLDFIISFNLIKVILMYKVKYVHFTTAHLSNIFLAFFLCFFRIKTIFTIHDFNPHPGKKSFFIKLYNKFIIKFISDIIVCHNKIDYNRQKEKGINCYFIPLSGLENKIQHSKVGSSILFFGRIDNYKGLGNLLLLDKELKNRNFTYNFVIAGKGHVDDLNKLKTLNNFKIINHFIPDDKLLDLFMDASFTILPYDSATQSGVILLSYSYATPVISFNVGSLSEYILDNETGHIVEYKDIKRIADIIINSSNDDIKRLSENTINYFIQNFSKEACLEYYKTFYNSL